MAGRGLGIVQVGGGMGEAEVPGGGLEGAQPIQRRQPGGHPFPTVRYMSLCHVARTTCRLSALPSGVIFQGNRLASGEQYVYLHTCIDDKSSWNGVFRPARGDVPDL